jgi:hypothetical protein
MGRYSVQSFVLPTFQVFAFLKIDVNILSAFSLLSAANWADERKYSCSTAHIEIGGQNIVVCTFFQNFCSSDFFSRK